MDLPPPAVAYRPAVRRPAARKPVRRQAQHPGSADGHSHRQPTRHPLDVPAEPYHAAPGATRLETHEAEPERPAAAYHPVAHRIHVLDDAPPADRRLPRHDAAPVRRHAAEAAPRPEARAANPPSPAAAYPSAERHPAARKPARRRARPPPSTEHHPH